MKTVLLMLICGLPQTTMGTLPQSTFPDVCRCGIDCFCGDGALCDCLQWADAKAEAIRTGKTLVVYVKTPTKQEPNCIAFHASSYAGDKTPRVVRLFPAQGQLWETRTRPQAWAGMPAFGGAMDCSGGR